MEGWRRWVRLSVALVVVLVLYFTVPVSFEVRASDVVQLLVSVAALVALSLIVLVQVRHQLVDAGRRVDGLVLALMIAVLGFALGFYVLAQRNPAEIDGLETRVDALYFTMSTLLTIGYGDVHAAGQYARVLVLVQMVFDVVVLATAASTLTTRVQSAAEQRRAAALRDAESDDSLPGHRRQSRRTHRNPT